jgi:hypothetical chaperone protein
LRHAAGPQAIAAYLDDPVGSRLIMSMKSHLAQRSFTQTHLFGRPFTLERLVGVFLKDLFAASRLDVRAARVVAGRPVRFSGTAADQVLGKQRLRAAFAEAGVPDIHVALEPEAAGYRFARGLAAPATVLVADFGGGTSDFSILRFAPGSAQPVQALAQDGVGVAGDTFDFRIIDGVVAPRLGKGDTYSIMGGADPADSARILRRLRAVAPPQPDADAAHDARDRRRGATCTSSGASESPAGTDRGRTGLRALSGGLGSEDGTVP